MPCWSMIRRPSQRLVERTFRSFCPVHAHVACCKLRKGVDVVRGLFKDMFELFCRRLPLGKMHVSVALTNSGDGELGGLIQ